MSNSTARFSANRLAKEIHEANENVVRVYANGGSEFELKKAINLISDVAASLAATAVKVRADASRHRRRWLVVHAHLVRDARANKKIRHPR